MIFHVTIDNKNDLECMCMFEYQYQHQHIDEYDLIHESLIYGGTFRQFIHIIGLTKNIRLSGVMSYP